MFSRTYHAQWGRLCTVSLQYVLGAVNRVLSHIFSLCWPGINSTCLTESNSSNAMAKITGLGTFQVCTCLGMNCSPSSCFRQPDLFLTTLSIHISKLGCVQGKGLFVGIGIFDSSNDELSPVFVLANASWTGMQHMGSAAAHLTLRNDQPYRICLYWQEMHPRAALAVASSSQTTQQPHCQALAQWLARESFRTPRASTSAQVTRSCRLSDLVSMLGMHPRGAVPALPFSCFKLQLSAHCGILCKTGNEVG